MKIGIFLFSFVMAVSSKSWASRSILFGHNLSPTTYSLSPGTFTLGNYIAAAGVTENFSIGSSPWLYTSYNMFSVLGRYGGSLDEKRRWSVQAAHFKTGRFPPDIYQMEASSLWLTVSEVLAEHYTFNIVLNYMYFFDETIPFSLRRESFNDQPWQISATTLQEIRLIHGFGILGELGFLGLNYAYPQIFYGASMHWRNNWLLVQVGFSQNMTLHGVDKLYSAQQGNSGGARSQAQSDLALHPEIHLQVFF